MKLSNDMIKNIRSIIDEQEIDTRYGYIGVRIQEQSFELGVIDHLSHIWDDGDDTEEELNGICAINVRDLELACEYYGDHVAIIAGNSATYGEDVGEIIIEDAVVAAIIC